MLFCHEISFVAIYVLCGCQNIEIIQVRNKTIKDGDYTTYNSAKLRLKGIRFRI